MWWSGPPDSESFKPADWGQMHSEKQNAIFTMAIIQGREDSVVCSSPNDFRLYLGTARRVFAGDLVVAVEATISDEVKAILIEHKAVVYVLPPDLCSRATRSIFCGSPDERVPASVFRYYFYEKWASRYSDSSFIMITDFRDIVFQTDPFDYRLSDWFPEYQLVVFQGTMYTHSFPSFSLSLLSMLSLLVVVMAMMAIVMVIMHGDCDCGEGEMVMMMLVTHRCLFPTRQSSIRTW